VTQRRRLTSSAFIIALVTTFLLPGPLSAADTSEVESLRSEVRQLQAQLQVLRSAVAEATELEGRRSANLARQMRDSGQNAAVAETLPPTGSDTGVSAREARVLPAPAVATAEPTARGKQRRNRHSTRARSKSTRAK